MSNYGSDKMRIKIYLLLVIGVCVFLGITAYFTQNLKGRIVYQILQKGFTAFPVIAAVFTNSTVGAWRRNWLAGILASQTSCSVWYEKGCTAQWFLLGNCALAANFLRI